MSGFTNLFYFRSITMFYRIYFDSERGDWGAVVVRDGIVPYLI
jgi:hypothetical protein